MQHPEDDRNGSTRPLKNDVIPSESLQRNDAVEGPTFFRTTLRLRCSNSAASLVAERLFAGYR
jgi:hypothetical protein